MSDSLELLDQILAQPARVIGLVELVLRSVASYQDHNWALSLIQSWSVVEALLRTLWDRYLEQNRQREIEGEMTAFINGDRKARLTKGPDMGASIIIEFLSLLGQLDFSVYQQVSQARRSRNSWLHDLSQPTPTDARISHEASTSLLADIYEIDVSFPLTLTW